MDSSPPDSDPPPRGGLLSALHDKMKLIAGIVGAVAVIIGAVVGVIRLLGSEDRPTTASPPESSTSPSIPEGTASTAAPEPEADILYPPEGSDVSSPAEFSGTASNLGSEYDLWLVGTPPDSSQFFPQDGPITVDRDGHWILRVFVQTDTDAPEDAGKPFRYHTLVVANEYSEDLEDCREETCGLDELPPGSLLGPPRTVIRE